MGLTYVEVIRLVYTSSIIYGAVSRANMGLSIAGLGGSVALTIINKHVI